MTAREIERGMSKARSDERRRQLGEFLLGCAVGLVLLIVMSAPWDRL